MKAKIENYMHGFAKAIDLGGTLRSPKFDQIIFDDVEATRSDWVAVGKDISYALRVFDEQQHKQSE